MRGRPIRIVLALFASAVSAIVAACGVDLAGSGAADAGADVALGVDATVPPDGEDAGAEAAPLDDASDDGGTGAHDGGQPKDSGSDAGPDATPDGGPLTYQCPGGAPTTDCSKCPGHSLGCVLCSTSSTDVFAVCAAPGRSCYEDSKPAGFDWCRCDFPSASRCVLPNQECNPYDGGVCVTCGERQTDNYQCKIGGKCHESPPKCQ